MVSRPSSYPFPPSQLRIVVFDTVINRMRASISRSSTEVGGKLLGRLVQQERTSLIRIESYVDSGPAASRSATHLYPDSEYQDSVFRLIEHFDPSIEHFGSWHSHHPNGLKELSSGDISGYTSSINDPRYRMPYFLAILVTGVNKGQLDLKFYLFSKAQLGFQAIPEPNVDIVHQEHAAEVVLQATESASDKVQIKSQNFHSSVRLREEPAVAELRHNKRSVLSFNFQMDAHKPHWGWGMAYKRPQSDDNEEKRPSRNSEPLTSAFSAQSLPTLQLIRAEDNRWFKAQGFVALRTLRDSQTGMLSWRWEAITRDGKFTLRYQHLPLYGTTRDLEATLEIHSAERLVAQRTIKLDESRFSAISSVLHNWGVM